MPTFNIETVEINIFDMGERYIFKTHFGEAQLFKRLGKYYNKVKYRFEIPDGDLKRVRKVHDKYYYQLDAEDSVEDYCVVVDRKSKSANTLRNSVKRIRKGEHEILVMKDDYQKASSREERCRPGKIRGRKEDLEWKPR